MVAPIYIRNIREWPDTQEEMGRQLYIGEDPNGSTVSINPKEYYLLFEQQNIYKKKEKK